MAMESSRHTARASEVYNAFSDEDKVVPGSPYDPSIGYVDEVDIVGEDKDDGWTPVHQVTFQEAKSTNKCKTNAKTNSPKKSPLCSPKTSLKKVISKAKIESARKSSPITKKILPEIVDANIQQYRPVYQAYHFTNENLVPKPYTSRYYTGNITVHPFRAPVAIPRTILPELEGENISQTMVKETITEKPLRESKDTRGKVKKSPDSKKEYDMNNAEKKLRSSLTDIKKFIEADYANERELARDNKISECRDNQQKGCMHNSRPNSLVLSGKSIVIEEPVINIKKNTCNNFSLSSNDSQNSGDPCSLNSDLSSEETLALSVLEAAVSDSKSDPFYNCPDQPFHSYSELEIMTGEAQDHTEESRKPSVSVYPENAGDSKDSLDSVESVSQSFERPSESEPLEEQSLAAGFTDSLINGITPSKDSLDGFLSDDMNSLRDFITHQSLDLGEAQLEKDEEPIEKSFDFIFEDVLDSPTHTADIPDTIKNVLGDKKSNKKSPLFSRFTQKVSDRNKENEEKSKTSPFHPKNLLSFGTKDKKQKEKNRSESTKTEGWTLEAMEDYILKNSKEEALRLGLLDEEDVAFRETKAGNPKVPPQRDIPVITVHTVVKISGVACKKRPAPEPPQLRKSPSWRPKDIENYLMENNMVENLRLGLISKEDIEIYEWKRATGMSPICDTSWTRETLRKNKIIRGSSSSSLSGSSVDSTASSPQNDLSSGVSRSTPSRPREYGTDPTQEIAQRASTPRNLSRSLSPRKAPSPPVPAGDTTSSERGVDVQKSPAVLPIRRRARAPPPPPVTTTSAISAVVALPPATPEHKPAAGYFAFRGFRIGQRMSKGVSGGISFLSQAVSGSTKGGVSGQQDKAESPSTSTEANSEAKPGAKPEAKPEANSEVKTESMVRKLGLDKIGVRLPGLGKEISQSASWATTSSETAPVEASDFPTRSRISKQPTKSRDVPLTPCDASVTKREPPYRKLARFLGRDGSPATPPTEVPATAVFLRESTKIEAEESADDEEGGIRKKLSDMKLKLGWLRRKGDTQVSVRPLPEEVQSWAESFHTLMASKYGQALFKAFLQREFSEENVEFWLAVEDFRKTRAAKMPSKASKIHSDYVAVQAPKEINLDPDTRARIAKSLDCPDKCIFDAAQKRVQALMESDGYLRFLQSELYKELLHPETSPSSNPETL